jgi:hypothetical protein
VRADILPLRGVPDCTQQRQMTAWHCGAPHQILEETKLFRSQVQDRPVFSRGGDDE